MTKAKEILMIRISCRKVKCKNDFETEVKKASGKKRREIGGISDSQLKVRIAEALEEMPPDVLRLLYRNTKANESGIE